MKGCFCSVIALAALLLAPSACNGLGHSGERPAGTRQVELIVPTELITGLGNQVTAIQLAAVVVDGSAGFSLHTSPTVDPTAQALLIAYFPQAESIALVVQSSGRGGAGTAGALLAQVRFADGRGSRTALVPRGDDDLDLGRPQFEGTTAADSWLTIDDSHNPLFAIDSDGDGTSDLTDSDDDGDSTPDVDDTDVDGDGRVDQQQALAALADADADGVPDLFE